MPKKAPLEEAQNDDDQVRQLLCELQGKGEGKGKSGKGPNNGKGLCFNCGEVGHYAASCPKPRKEGQAKGAEKCKSKGKGIHALVGIFKAVGVQVPKKIENDKAGNALNLIRPMCCLTRCSVKCGDNSVTRQAKIAEDHGRYDNDFPEASAWISPKGAVRIKLVTRGNKVKKAFLSAFMLMNEGVIDNEDSQNTSGDVDSSCSSLSGNEEFWFPDDDDRKKESIRRWDAKRTNRSIDDNCVPVGDIVRHENKVRASPRIVFGFVQRLRQY